MPDDIQAKIAKAKAAGYSDAEIQAYLSKAGPQIISGEHQAPIPSGSMQSAPGAPITANGQTVANPQQLQAQTNDALLRSGNYGALAEAKENDPKRKAYEASSMRWASPGIRPDVAMRAIAGTVVGTIPGAAIGRYIAGPKYGDIGAGIGGFAGGLYGGYRGANEKPIIPGGISKLPGMIGRIGRGLEMLGSGETPSAGPLPGAAPEATGGTAATAGETAASQTQATGPKNASELSSVANRVKHGQPPSSPTIYTPESLASEQGMSTAALGKGGFNLTIPPEQQRIMQLVGEGRVPMGKTPAQGGFESLFRKEPFPAPQPPSGESPSFGEPEGAIDAAIRGAAGQNPAIKATDKAMASEMPNKIKLMESLRRFKRKGL